MPQSLQRTQYAGAEEGVCQERWVASVDLPGIEVPLLGGSEGTSFCADAHGLDSLRRAADVGRC
jgi:hypothetical protein